MIAGGLGGDWLLSSARTPDGEAYGGTLTVEADDDAWDCRWHTNLPGRPKMWGVGILDADRFVASRTVDAKRTGESSPSPGVVIYRPTGEGTLPARWYHPDLEGRLGTGLSTGGVPGRLPGRYTADYETGAKEPFETLAQVISGKSNPYFVQWLLGTRPLYHGIGLDIGNRFVVGWADPQVAVEVLVYGTLRDGEDFVLCGQWARIEHGGLGAETAARA